jgi:hypothetical protein
VAQVESQITVFEGPKDRMNEEFSDAELEAFLDEAIDAVRAAEIEQAARQQPTLLKRLSAINRRRDQGAHSLGAIWRRFQVGVPSAETLGQYVLGILDSEHANYIRFRVETLKCPFTIALLADLQAAEDQAYAKKSRQQRDSIYQSGTEILTRQGKRGDL